MRRQIIPTAIALALATACTVEHDPPATHPRATDQRARVLQACEEQFGAPADRDGALFEVDADFALQVEFDDDGHLQQLSVQPKHWFGDSHPDWDREEDVGEMSVDQLASLLERLDQIHARGPRITTEDQPVLRGTELQRRDVYEHAVVVTGELIDDTRPPDAPPAFRYLLFSPAAAGNGS